MACALTVSAAWMLSSVDAQAQAATAGEIAALIEARDFQRAALEIGSVLKANYPEARADTRACERAINRGDGKSLDGACELDSGYVNETAVELTNIAMGRSARGQFFAAAKAVAALHRVKPTEGSKALVGALAPGTIKDVSATADDLARGGPFVTEAMAAFEGAVAAAEAGDWAGACRQLDQAMPTLPDYRTIHLLRFVACKRAGTNRDLALRDYGGTADSGTKVLIDLLRGGFAVAELDARLAATAPSPQLIAESHYYAAQAAYLAGDQATYRQRLQQMLSAPETGSIEYRLAAAEAKVP